ncbi:MAG: hypothetical protein NZ561_07625 [Phycisphaerae bacterium]|nr:hypothetical protein [Phycisphaerae bacterium]MDW8263342.1 hypothetical protein [Phycisphaerales bacterium]
MRWSKPAILREIRTLYRRKVDLSYHAMARQRQALVSAAAYHFGSYAMAVEKAGIDYATIRRRPWWTRQRIIARIKQARRQNLDLHWSAVVRRRDELGRCAFAALQKRLFGGWDRALHAAGLHAEEVSLYRQWDRASIAYELRARYLDGEPMNSACVQREEPALHAAAIRYFGSYDRALRAARIDPAKVRKRRKPRKLGQKR